MEENIKLNKEVFAKRPYNKIIDTSFNEFGIVNIQEQLDAQPTVQEFFNLYTELFYQINELGPNNSHEYLVKTSGEYISFDEGNELIEALQAEIASLRKELLQKEQQLTNALLPEDERLPASELSSFDDVNDFDPTSDSSSTSSNPIAGIVSTPPPDVPAIPLPKATIEDQNQYNAGYRYQVVTWKAMNNNLAFFNNNQDLLPYRLDNEQRDLNEIRTKKKGKIDNEANWMVWTSSIRRRSSGKETANLRKILEYTVNSIRTNFVKTKKFGNGYISSRSEIN